MATRSWAATTAVGGWDSASSRSTEETRPSNVAGQATAKSASSGIPALFMACRQPPSHLEVSYPVSGWIVPEDSSI